MLELPILNLKKHDNDAADYSIKYDFGSWSENETSEKNSPNKKLNHNTQDPKIQVQEIKNKHNHELPLGYFCQLSCRKRNIFLIKDGWMILLLSLKNPKFLAILTNSKCREGQ